MPDSDPLIDSYIESVVDSDATQADTAEAELSSADGHKLHRQQRNSRLILAVGTSFISKIAAVGAQLLAVTLGVRLLGVDGYANYAAILAASMIPYLFAVGYGPSLVSRIAHLDSESDTAGLRRVTWSAVIPILVYILGIGIVATMAVVGLTLFPHERTIVGSIAASNTFVLLALAWFQLAGAVFNTVETIQVGFQESHIMSIRTLVGNVLIIVSLLVLFWPFPYLWMFVACLHLPPFLCRIANTAILLLRKPWLRPILSSVDWKLSKLLLADGVKYSLVAGLGAFLCHQFPVLLLKQFSSSEATTLFSTTMTLILQLFAVISLLVVPLIPALSNSIATHDVAWARRAVHGMLAFITGYGLLSILALTVFGQLFFRVWFHGNLSPDLVLLFSAGTYLLVLGLENFLFLLLCAGRQLRLATTLFLIRAFLTAGFAILAARRGSPSIVFAGGTASVLLVTLFPYLYVSFQSVQAGTSMTPAR